MNFFNLKNSKHLKIFAILITLLSVSFLANISVPFIKHTVNRKDYFPFGCTIFDPNTYKFPTGFSVEQCIADNDCHLSGYLVLESNQDKVLRQIGPAVKNIDDLKEEGYDIYSATNTIEKIETYSAIELLTHGEVKIPDGEIKYSEEEIKILESNSSGEKGALFLRKTFDDYVSGKDISILDENITKTCHVVNDEIFGLDGFSKTYFKSKFVVLGAYRHLYNGEDVFILFLDKPNKVFRVWTGYKKNGDRQLMMIKEIDMIPREEIDAILKAYKSVFSDPRFYY